MLNFSLNVGEECPLYSAGASLFKIYIFFKDIKPLQTTRKENNWKTEEALVRAAVNLETERIEGSNP